MRTKVFTACLCLLFVSGCGNEDYTSLVRNGFWAGNRVSPISSAVDTWQGCFSGSQSWKTVHDKNNQASVVFTCRLGKNYTRGLLDLMKNLHALASRHTDAKGEFRKIFAKDLAGASDLRNVTLKLTFPVANPRSFSADKTTPAFIGEWGDGTELPIGTVTTEDMVNTMFRIPIVPAGGSQKRVLDVGRTLQNEMQRLIGAYFEHKKINFGVTSITQDGKTYANLNDNNGKPLLIEYPYYKVTSENVEQAVNSLLVPNTLQCNRWYESRMRGLLGSSEKRGEFEAFNSLCRMDPRMEPGYSATTRVGYEVVSDRQYAMARRFMYQLRNSVVNETTCRPDYWDEAVDVINEFGNDETKARAAREVEVWKNRCLTRTSENGFTYLRKAALFRAASPHVCSSGVAEAMYDRRNMVHLSERDKAFIDRKFKAIREQCASVGKIAGIASSPEASDLISPPGTKDAKSLQEVAANIDYYVSVFFCKDKDNPDSPCHKPGYIERLKSDEYAAFKRLTDASPERYNLIEELVCGELGYCSYGVLSDIYFADALKAGESAVPLSSHQTAGLASVPETAEPAAPEQSPSEQPAPAAGAGGQQSAQAEEAAAKDAAPQAKAQPSQAASVKADAARVKAKAAQPASAKGRVAQAKTKVQQPASGKGKAAQKKSGNQKPATAKGSRARSKTQAQRSASRKTEKK